MGEFRQVGSLSRVCCSHAAESRPPRLAVVSSDWMAAARFPASSEPANSQFFLPIAIGRMVSLQRAHLYKADLPCEALVFQKGGIVDGQEQGGLGGACFGVAR
jgi:hypothetical protein